MTCMASFGGRHAGDNARVQGHKQAAKTADGSSPFERKPRVVEAFSSLMSCMVVLLLEGLLSEASKGINRMPQLGETAIGAPLCMWLVSLSTGSSEKPT